MCKEKKHIVFCTCNDREDNRLKLKAQAFKILGDKEEYNKTYYAWTLVKTIRKYTEEEKSTIIGQMFSASKKLDTELTAEFVVKQLNEKADFDFEYIPEDGDELSVRLSYKYVHIKNHDRALLPPPMNFVFENEEWYFGYIDYFEYKQETIDSGKVMLNYNSDKL